MGLDMYLEGRLMQMGGYGAPDKVEKRTGKKVSSINVELGYWRKHPDLHGYIINNFADGNDECQEIWLGREQIEQILTAIEKDELAHGTEGFFFGKSYQPGEKDEYGSYEQQKADDLATFREALAWLDELDQEASKARQEMRAGEPAPVAWFPDVIYRASW